MSAEFDFIAVLRAIATHPAARGLADDAAVLGDLVLTHDMLVEGVHWLAGDPPGDVAWKLVAVNLSDLAAKGAEPLGVLLGYALTGDREWDAAFVAGLGQACEALGVSLLGGDTVSLPKDAPRVLGLTAIGRAATAPSRSGARPGDRLWVTGTIGDAGAGLKLAREGGAGPLVERYRRPTPRLAAGRALAPLVTAMCDVSDGLLIDASRIAGASGVGLVIDLAAVPLSPGLPLSRIAAVTAGDDYELLFTLPPGMRPEAGVPVTAIGRVEAGSGLALMEDDRPVPLPERLGWEHG